MLTDTIVIKHKTAVTYGTLATTDLSSPGKSIRKDALLHKLTISGQSTAENPTYDSKRISIRLDQLIPQGTLGGGLGAKANLFAQLIIGYPVDESLTDSMIATIVTALMHALLGGNSVTVPIQSDNSDLLAMVPRLRAGEV